MIYFFMKDWIFILVKKKKNLTKKQDWLWDLFAWSRKGKSWVIFFKIFCLVYLSVLGTYRCLISGLGVQIELGCFRKFIAHTNRYLQRAACLWIAWITATPSFTFLSYYVVRWEAEVVGFCLHEGMMEFDFHTSIMSLCKKLK